ncbi:unnamed protein product [Angiostrongylus costaricensis]|uniref:Uncharacterized protein n=1 Tax=Angiostrongylus costaricensis TaxID=334426 RepID=A0A158PF12_ANGCS|nr:unnamed protein product [Angiostrongylus costaricensis]
MIPCFKSFSSKNSAYDKITLAIKTLRTKFLIQLYTHTTIIKMNDLDETNVRRVTIEVSPKNDVKPNGNNLPDTREIETVQQAKPAQYPTAKAVATGGATTDYLSTNTVKPLVKSESTASDAPFAVSTTPITESTIGVKMESHAIATTSHAILTGGWKGVEMRPVYPGIMLLNADNTKRGRCPTGVVLTSTPPAKQFFPFWNCKRHQTSLVEQVTEYMEFSASSCPEAIGVDQSLMMPLPGADVYMMRKQMERMKYAQARARTMVRSRREISFRLCRPALPEPNRGLYG